jgi:hypothetical protein
VRTAAALGLVLVACSDKPAPPVAATASAAATESAPLPPPVSLPPLTPPVVDEATRAKADMYGRMLQRGALEPTALRQPGNARAFLYLAGAREEAMILVGALRAMATIYAAQDAPARVKVDADYHRVVAARLGHPDPKVLAAALDAAKHSVTGPSPDPTVIDQVVTLAGRHVTAQGRHAALEVLWMVAGVGDDEKKVAPFLLALEAEETWLVTTALHRLRGFERLVARDAVLARASELVDDADAGVRGRAAELLAALGGDPKRILPLLRDGDGYVRAAACAALVRLGHVPAVHAIVPLAGDDASAVYELAGFEELDGRPGRVRHDVGQPKVSAAALSAIARLSEKTPERYDFVAASEADLGKAAERAKAWYERVKDAVPAE